MIARGDKPLVRLVVVEPERKPDRVPGLLKGKISLGERFFEPFPEDELRLWEGG